MIYIEKDKLTITVEKPFIEDYYANTIVELIDLIYSQDDSIAQNHRYVLQLIESMMPDYKQIKAMRGIKADSDK